MALGANRKKILKQVVGEGMKLAVTGAAIGMALAVPLPRVLEGLLQDFRVSGTWVYALIPAVICGVALLASYVPARRAARVDPMVALRYE
jgi:putative ABC transport system permease protein